jgi:N-acyl-D-aspartate/D-glutamate deacylase
MTTGIDLLIQGGTVVDGTGAPPFRADVAVHGGRIIEVGAIPLQEGVPLLDAEGLLVAPGFIDIHSHSDFTLLVDPRAVSSITQGVTMEVVGNCGHGCAPIVQPELVPMNIYGYRPDYPLDWRSMGEYLAGLEAARPAVNVLSLTPNGNLRLAATGVVNRPAMPDELRKMKRLLAQSLEEGSWGLSTGLEYGPEQGCSEEEIIELGRVAARAGGLYATHTRNRMGEPVETIAEAIRTAAAAELPLQISHISVVARLTEASGWAVEQAIEQVERANAAGLDVGFDMHTRLFGTTNLSAALPPWALAGNKAAIAQRLRDPATRRELKAYPSIITALARGDWSRMVLCNSTAQPTCARRNLAEISQGWNVEPLEAIYQLLLAELELSPLDSGEALHGPMIIAFAYRAEDLRQAFAHTGCMVGSDATALAPDGPLANSVFHGAYTWAAWFFRHFVHEARTLTPAEAVRRLTSLPACRLGLSDRGVIRPGVWADLTIFDPAHFAEQGTIFAPNQVAVGVRHVLVNGVLSLQDGVLTSQRGGQVLRRLSQ